MSETKHTPGKWIHVETPSVRDVFNGCTVIASEEIEDAIIATVAEDVPDWQGNGALRAAAPQMLQALQRICAAVNGGVYQPTQGDFEACEAAIKAATEGQ